ncbi:hypothetical protein A3J90_05115 [candidate division WOR-1 bacterium RIFOXYC2_FULL_37_10]|uniref:Uncharacterized protein n=1 Tax=candidate division WOR-1 bacterium RIFOXYB2_FULL_37_13 TaxID=1802579 RepID=A0A1F4SMX4_UNCSA|nr:MAG: hypothetical protein A2246_06975 [candidate division WOR-1 bacterium RIFOXYA2_FULL_37_7]OGC21760.1 MAG: hypothetical protein A2310_00440 [candidate division WOR-1 bacterium RIFOXYB2_FULL_37_13]OGC36717.1 MAG: hypothetical protein A3J90_05115 [candidate division WOR-1 bacterium RIFOXYC2_FULL_37_10]
MAFFNVKFFSPLGGEINHSPDVDVIKTVKSFYTEMADLIKNYAELSVNPDPTKTLKIGNNYVNGANVNSSSTSLLLEDRMAKIDQAQSAILDIWNNVRKLEDRLSSM